MAQNHYQKERGLTLKCTQQDSRQTPRSTWKVKLLLQPMTFRQGAQHRRCLRVDDELPTVENMSFETQQTFFRSH